MVRDMCKGIAVLALVVLSVACAHSQPSTPGGKAAHDACANLRAMHKTYYLQEGGISYVLMKDAKHLVEEGNDAQTDPDYLQFGQGVVSFANRITEGAQRGINTETTYTIMGDEPAFIVMESLIRRCDDQNI